MGISRQERSYSMRVSRRHIIQYIIGVMIIVFLGFYKLPYYIYSPGSADSLSPIVEVDNGFTSEGDMHLVTVSGMQATPLQLIWAKIRPFHEVMPLEDVRPEGISDEDYMHAQFQMMESSQESSTVVAYEAADKGISIEFNGVYVVSVIEGMPAEGKLEMGDRIVGIDENQVKEADDLITYISDKNSDDVVEIEFVRDDKELYADIKLETLQDADGQIGIGIQLVTDRIVEVDPDVHFASGEIGGPSAGLMFALEIYDQLTEEDLTRGYQVIGTGEIDYDGTVHSIGGIDKKVVAADQEGGDIFFAHHNQGAEDSNYNVAKAAAEEIDTNMIIVPVDTFNDALSYLENLDPKEE